MPISGDTVWGGGHVAVVLCKDENLITRLHTKSNRMRDTTDLDEAVDITRQTSVFGSQRLVAVHGSPSTRVQFLIKLRLI
jgi:hypothetical protein